MLSSMDAIIIVIEVTRHAMKLNIIRITLGLKINLKAYQKSKRKLFLKVAEQLLISLSTVDNLIYC